MFVLNVKPTAKVIWRWAHSLKSHRTDWRSWESNLQPLVYKASGLSTTPQWLLLFGRILSGIPSECQTVEFQISPDILSSLVWVQTVCKGYQQTTQLSRFIEISEFKKEKAFSNIKFSFIYSLKKLINSLPTGAVC